MKLYKSQLLGATMDLTQKRIYFWGGIFSQWAKCNIHDPAFNVTFNCAEQAMMYRKADTFADEDAKVAVMAEKDPRGQKAIGRTIKGYDNDTWDQVKYNIVLRNNLLKFTQNPSLKELLILTDGYELVEASPYDKIWGVGLGEDDKMILDKDKWCGENLLGKAIVEVRERLPFN
jgi:ribA/ribD-fused uncharacterized protein